LGYKIKREMENRSRSAGPEYDYGNSLETGRELHIANHDESGDVTYNARKRNEELYNRKTTVTTTKNLKTLLNKNPFRASIFPEITFLLFHLNCLIIFIVLELASQDF
jgi:hypothetical protein